MRIGRPLALLGAALVAAAPAHAASVKVVPIGDPFENDATTGWAPLRPVALNVRDEVLVQTATGPGSLDGAAVWRAGAFTALVHPMPVYGASDLLDDGSVVGFGHTPTSNGAVAFVWDAPTEDPRAYPEFDVGLTRLRSGILVGVRDVAQPGACDPEPRTYWGGTRADQSFETDVWNHAGALAGTGIRPTPDPDDDPCAKVQGPALWSGVGSAPTRLPFAATAIGEDGLVVGMRNRGWAASGPGAASILRLPPGAVLGAPASVGVDGYVVGYAQDAQGVARAWGQKGGRWLDLRAKFPLAGALAGWTARGAVLVNAKGDVVLRLGKGTRRRYALATIRFVLGGAVTDRGGDPLGGVPVTAAPRAGTGSGGRFRLTVAAGTYRLTVAGIARTVKVVDRDVALGRLAIDPPRAIGALDLVSGSTATIAARRVRLPVACHLARGTCRIAVALKRGRVAYGAAAVDVAAGRHATLAVPLTAAARTAVARGRMTVATTLVVTGAGRSYRPRAFALVLPRAA